MPHNVGYCCINLSLQKKKIFTSRTMRKATFQEKGLSYAAELALQNAKDLVKIVYWNAEQNIKVFRMGSDIFPWASEYNITSLPNYFEIAGQLSLAGSIARSTNQRITAHPDHFVKLGSEKPSVVKNSIRDLEIHGEVFDMMGLERSPYNAINIHVGMNYNPAVIKRWITNYKKLSPSVQSRLVVENDDKANAFSVVQLFTHLYSEIKTPITFDYFHHQFHTDGLSTQHAAELAAGTWPEHITPLFHYSESKNVNEKVKGNPRAHADYVFSPIDDFGLQIDVDLEAKAKELALFKYREFV